MIQTEALLSDLRTCEMLGTAPLGSAVRIELWVELCKLEVLPPGAQEKLETLLLEWLVDARKLADFALVEGLSRVGPLGVG